MAQIKVGDEVVLIEPFKVFRLLSDGRLDICDSDGNCISVNPNQVMLKTTNMKAMKDAVLKVAQDLAKAKNTVTTLEIKVELRRDYPYYFWDQKVVSLYMDQLAGDGVFTYTDNGTYRTYSLVGIKPVSVPVTKSLNTIIITKSVSSLAGGVVKVQKTRIDHHQLLKLVANQKFVGLTLANGTVVSRQDIKRQKKSPLGYASPKLGKIKSIVVGTTQYNVK